MKWIAIFLGGVLLGAITVVVSLSRIAPAPAPLVASLPALVAAVMPCVAMAPITVPDLGASLTLPAKPAAVPVTATPVHTTPAAEATGLLIPVAGISASQLADTFDQGRGSTRRHDALDILAARGTPVLAVADGTVAKLFDSRPGGLTVYQFDSTEQFAYYYAHLDRYAAGIAEGRVLKRGDLVGYVGSSGNANAAAPHLHFAIFELGPEKQWWKGRPINPYPLLTGATPP